jgi:hypothetical protein
MSRPSYANDGKISTVHSPRRFETWARRIPVLLLAAACATGCAKAGMVISPDAYRQTTYGYSVPFSSTGVSAALGPDWRLDNFTCDSGGDCKEKRGRDYVALREYDEDRDGTVTPSEKSKEAIYDVRFVNAVHGGVIWVKAHPVHPEDARLELAAIVSTYADSLGGTGLYAQGSVFSIEQPKARQFTTFVTNEQAIELGPHKAIAATVELAEVAKLTQNPAHRDSKVRVIVTKFKYFHPLDRWSKEAFRKGKRDKSDDPVVERNGEPGVEKVALLMVGYYNTTARFDDGLGSFESFVSSLQFDPIMSVPYAELQVGRIDTPPAEPKDSPPEGQTPSADKTDSDETGADAGPDASPDPVPPGSLEDPAKEVPVVSGK